MGPNRLQLNVFVLMQILSVRFGVSGFVWAWPQSHWVNSEINHQMRERNHLKRIATIKRADDNCILYESSRNGVKHCFATSKTEFLC